MDPDTGTNQRRRHCMPTLIGVRKSKPPGLPAIGQRPMICRIGDRTKDGHRFRANYWIVSKIGMMTLNPRGFPL